MFAIATTYGLPMKTLPSPSHFRLTNRQIGGHILGCQNIPTTELDYKTPEMVRTLRDKNLIVFHCALSQQRGPSSALKYLRERERLVKKGQVEARADGEGLIEMQRVVVLEGGFVKWQEV